MRKRLFNEYDATNEDGRRLSDAVSIAITPIVKLWIADGYDGRDVQSVIDSEVGGICAETILRRATQTRKFERETARAIADGAMSPGPVQLSGDRISARPPARPARPAL